MPLYIWLELIYLNIFWVHQLIINDKYFLDSSPRKYTGKYLKYYNIFKTNEVKKQI